MLKDEEYRGPLHKCIQMTSEKCFGFPGTPYKSQTDLMQALYDGLSRGGLIVLESPTGTGKSLGLICGSLTWLIEHRKSLLLSKMHTDRTDAVDSSDDENIPAWLQDHTQNHADRVAQDLIHRWSSHLLLLKERVSKLGLMNSDGSLHSLRLSSLKRKRETKPEVPLLESNDVLPETKAEQAAPEPDVRPKVYFCSRTHSQLSQMIREIRKTKFNNSLSMLTLSSRRQTCVHPGLTESRSTDAASLEEGCRKLVDSSRCEYYGNVNEISVLLGAELRDIEDQYGDGVRLGACPYYGARHASNSADVILVPYSSILCRETRSSLGICLRGNIVVIDEAHNILEALNSSLTIMLTVSDLDDLICHVSGYAKSYESGLAPRNLVLIKKVGFLVKLVRCWLTSNDTDALYSVPQFLNLTNIGPSDLTEVTLFLENSDFKRKLRGYTERTVTDGPKNGSAVYTLLQLLVRLQSHSSLDRILLHHSRGTKELAFVVIDSDREFVQIVKEAHSVVLAGGTMKPLDEYRNIAQSSDVPFTSFLASHRVEPDRLFVGIIAESRAGEELLFTHQHRSSQRCLNALEDIVTSVILARPRGGVIMFVPSYEYAEEVGQKLCTRREDSVPFTVVVDSRREKPVLILEKFRKCLQQHANVLLISVVGGNLSEGIDFRDELCRCVMIVGLPYANPADPVLMERMKYLDRRRRERGSGMNGDLFYQVKCMRAVNQSVGRSIRHSRDWASVLLIDQRFRRPAIQHSLSEWIKMRLTEQSVASLQTNLDQFHTAASSKYSS